MSAVEKRMFCTEMTCYVNKSIDFFFFVALIYSLLV